MGGANQYQVSGVVVGSGELPSHRRRRNKSIHKTIESGSSNSAGATGFTSRSMLIDPTKPGRWRVSQGPGVVRPLSRPVPKVQACNR
jgi:hypothetical protein